MIGLGTQDTLDFAQAFVNDFELTIDMVWDESFESWNELGIRSQPSSVLIGIDGEVLGAWGGINEADVLSLI